MEGDEGERFFAEFGPEGSVAYISGRDGTLRVWDAAFGSLLFELPAVGSGRPSTTADGRVLIGDVNDKVARLLDPSRRGKSTSVETCRGFAPAGAFQVVGDAAAFLISCDHGRNTAVVADMRKSEIGATIRDVSGQDMALSPDGSKIVAQTLTGSIWGPLQVYDARSGETVLRLEGMCAWDNRFGDAREEAAPPCKPYPETPFPIWAYHVEFSPDGRPAHAARRRRRLTIWNADSGGVHQGADGRGLRCRGNGRRLSRPTRLRDRRQRQR